MDGKEQEFLSDPHLLGPIQEAIEDDGGEFFECIEERRLACVAVLTQMLAEAEAGEFCDFAMVTGIADQRTGMISNVGSCVTTGAYDNPSMFVGGLEFVKKDLIDPDFFNDEEGGDDGEMHDED